MLLLGPLRGFPLEALLPRLECARITGKHITVDGMTLFRFRDGKIVEEWSVYDILSAMRQAGLHPGK